MQINLEFFNGFHLNDQRNFDPIVEWCREKMHVRCVSVSTSDDLKWFAGLYLKLDFGFRTLDLLAPLFQANSAKI